MRKIILLNILFLALATSFLYSQTWERAFSLYPGYDAGAYTICKLSDGNFLVGGFAEDINVSSARILKVTPFGDSLWSKRFYAPNSENCVIKSSIALSDGCFIVVGSCQIRSSNKKSLDGTAFAAKFDTNGNIIWIKNYLSNGIDYLLNDIIVANDEGFLCGSPEYILKIDNNGNYKWHKPYTFDSITSFSKLKVFDNNSYICSTQDVPNSKFYILKINNNGETLWMKQVTDYVYPEYLFLNSNNIISLGGFRQTGTNYLKLVLQTYDTACNFIRSRQCIIPRYDFLSRCYLSINSNRFLFSSVTPLTLDTHFCAVRILDTNLNIVHSLDLTTKGGSREIFSAIMQDNNYIFAAGYYRNLMMGGNDDFYVIKTDTSLNLHVSIGIRKIESEIPKEFSLYQNYPNPFNPDTKIKFSVHGQSKINMSIYDITGKMVQTLINRNMQTGTYEVTWDASQLPSGTYFCKMTTDKFSRTIKLVLLK
ncbi:MAG: T9SS type A sorting domain-containing protein [Ignavibacteria bacterium]|nr:T9SS type A sorting domain-containing protein [Ignavibacteria bacterium]